MAARLDVAQPADPPRRRAIAGQPGEQLLVQRGERRPLGRRRAPPSARSSAPRARSAPPAPPRRPPGQRDRDRARVGAGPALGQPGLRKAVDEPHGAGVRQPERCAQRVDRLAAEVALERGQRGRRRRPERRGDRGLHAARDRERERAEQVGLAGIRASHSHIVRSGAWIRAPRPSTTSARSSPAPRRSPPPRTCPSCGAEHATQSRLLPSCGKRYDRRFARVSDTPALDPRRRRARRRDRGRGPDPPRRVRRQARHDARVAREHAARVAAEKARLTREQRPSAAARPACARRTPTASASEQLAARHSS